MRALALGRSCSKHNNLGVRRHWVFVAFPWFDRAKDIFLFTRYIYFHPLNPLCEGGRDGRQRVRLQRSMGSGSNPAQADSRMLLLWREGRCGILQTRSIPIRGWTLCEVLETYPKIWWAIRRHLSRLNAGNASIDAQYAPIGWT